MNRETILIAVADEPLLRLCAAILQGEGYHVIASGSPSAALQTAKTEPVDVVIAEEVSAWNGDNPLKAIRQRLPAAGVVLVRNSLASQLAGAGRHEDGSIVTQPVTRENLLASVQEALESESRLREKIRLQTLRPLFEIGKTFTGQYDLEQALKAILDSALQETKAQGGAIFLFDEENGELKPRVERHTLPDGKDMISLTIANLVASTGEPLVIADSNQSGAQVLLSEADDPSVSTLCVPLQVGKKAVGALQVYKTASPAGFMESDLELLSIAGGQIGVAVENKRLNSKLDVSYLNIVASLASALEARDHEVQDHCRTLAACSVATGHALRFSERDLESLRLGGMFHDIGKIGIPDSILRKPAPLTAEEYTIIKKHPEIGAEILKPVEMLKDVIPLVRHHHERFDGRGYPDSLLGAAIPLGARILAVADAYTAMTSTRPYRSGLSHEDAVKELKANAGTQLDPKIVETFIDVWQPVETVA